MLSKRMHLAHVPQDKKVCGSTFGCTTGFCLDSLRWCCHSACTQQLPIIPTSLSEQTLCVYRYVHIGESHRGSLGTGSVDFEGLFSALSRTGYSGPLTFESFSSSVVSKDLSNTLCVWRNLWDDSEVLAQHARQYISRQMDC
jgi:hypothetical protein